MKNRNVGILALAIFFIIDFILNLTKLSNTFRCYVDLAFGIVFLVIWWLVPRKPEKPD